jgi:hypothetical protein
MVSATEAARLLHRPEMTQTFRRRAQEAYKRGDKRIQHIGRLWCAPMEFWRTIKLRPVGRKPRFYPRAQESLLARLAGPGML